MINRVNLADAIRYIEYQIKDTEYFMIQPTSFLKEAIKLRKVIPLFHFSGHATITLASRTRFENIRQTMRINGYFTVPYSLPEYDGTFANYWVELDSESMIISNALVYDLEYVDVIQLTAPFQKHGEFIEPNFHDQIQLEKYDMLNLYRRKPLLDENERYRVSDTATKAPLDEIEIKTENLYFELSQLKALFNLKSDKTTAPTVTQTQPPNNEQLIKELAAAKAYIAELEQQQKAHISTSDEPTHHKSVGSMQALIATLIKMAEYNKANLADPYGELNKLIQAKAEILGLSVKKDFVAKWLKKADDVL